MPILNVQTVSKYSSWFKRRTNAVKKCDWRSRRGHLSNWLTVQLTLRQWWTFQAWRTSARTTSPSSTLWPRIIPAIITFLASLLQQSIPFPADSSNFPPLLSPAANVRIRITHTQFLVFFSVFYCVLLPFSVINDDDSKIGTEQQINESFRLT